MRWTAWYPTRDCPRILMPFFTLEGIAMLRILRFQQVMTKTMTSIARNPAYALIHTSHSRILMADKVNLSDAEWQAKLSPVQFKVLRQKGFLI